MKTIFTLFVSLLVLLTGRVQAATYTINANETWAAAGIPNSCTGCTITINTGFTLSLAANTTCMNCTFNGPGTLSSTNYNLDLLTTGGANDTYFNSANLVFNGTASLTDDAPIIMSTSVLTFNGTSTFKSDYTIVMMGSTVNLYGNSAWTVDGGPLDLINTSMINVGNGSLTSNSKFIMNGPTLNIVDNSSVNIGNQNNYYFNWGNYNYYTNLLSPPTSHSTTNTINCGGTYANACSGSNTYGPATINSGGTTATTILALVLVTFTAEIAGNNSVDLAWSTQMESNTSHFTIERSTDGISWNAIGEVAAKGLSTTVSDYNYTDANPSHGINYYRLEMVNLDGSYGYTDVRVVKTSVISNISFFPNPARDFVNVTLGQSETNVFTLRLYNQAGQLLQEKQVTGSEGTIVTFAIQQYTPGLYVLNVTAADGTRSNGKILIEH